MFTYKRNNRKSTKGRKFYMKSINQIISYSIVPKNANPELDMITATDGQNTHLNKDGVEVHNTFRTLKVRKVFVTIPSENMMNNGNPEHWNIMANAAYKTCEEMLKDMPNNHNYNIIHQYLKTSVRINLN